MVVWSFAHYIVFVICQLYFLFISESTIHFAKDSYHFDEDAQTVDVEIVREGTDLSHTTTVWCATRLSNPPSASAGRDYVPSSSQITFGPGQTSQVRHCQCTVVENLSNQ